MTRERVLVTEEKHVISTIGRNPYSLTRIERFLIALKFRMTYASKFFCPANLIDFTVDPGYLKKASI